MNEPAYRLSQLGSSFATRTRAREVAAEMVRSGEGSQLEVDLSGVVASPSFLAELLLDLAGSFLGVRVVGASGLQRGILARMIPFLGLTGRVSVDDAVSLSARAP